MKFVNKISPMTTEWKEGHQCLMKSWLYEYYGQKVKVEHDYINITMLSYEKLYELASIESLFSWFWPDLVVSSIRLILI